MSITVLANTIFELIVFLTTLVRISEVTRRVHAVEEEEQHGLVLTIFFLYRLVTKWGSEMERWVIAGMEDQQ
jgi:hypothetical protein